GARSKKCKRVYQHAEYRIQRSCTEAAETILRGWGHGSISANTDRFTVFNTGFSRRYRRGCYRRAGINVFRCNAWNFTINHTADCRRNVEYAVNIYRYECDDILCQKKSGRQAEWYIISHWTNAGRLRRILCQQPVYSRQLYFIFQY